MRPFFLPATPELGGALSIATDPNLHPAGVKGSSASVAALQLFPLVLPWKKRATKAEFANRGPIVKTFVNLIFHANKCGR